MNQKYFNINYLYKGRWISYWYQIKEVISLKGHSILEIGPGNKIVSDTLKKMGLEIKTMDTDPDTNPDFINNILDPNFAEENIFDTIL